MATHGTFHTALTPSTRSTESSLKNVKNHRSADDEVPEVVALPVGTYTVVARSERDGYGHVLVVIKEGQQAILDLDLWETKTQRSLAHN